MIATAVKNLNPYKNLIVNGIVLAEDGAKMSKRLKNYPDPMYMVNTYSADAIKLYLLNSPIVKGESLKFAESGVKNVLDVSPFGPGVCSIFRSLFWEILYCGSLTRTDLVRNWNSLEIKRTCFS